MCDERPDEAKNKLDIAILDVCVSWNNKGLKMLFDD